MERILRILVLAAGLVVAGPATADENLQIVIRTAPNVSYDHVTEAFVSAITKLGDKKHGSQIVAFKDGKTDGKIADKVYVRDITAADYNAYQRLENPDAILSPLPSRKKDDLEVRQLPAATPTWEFNLLGDKPKELSKLEVTYKGSSDTPEVLEPSTKRGDPLTMTQFGSYVLTPPSDKKPLKYKAHVRELKQEQDVIVEGEWPKGDNFYLIRLYGFKGDKKELEATIRDPGQKGIGGSALDSFNIKNDVVLALGEAGATDDELEEDEIKGNKLVVSVPPNRRGNAARVYMLFPLTKEQMEAELKALNDPDRAAGAVAKAIRARNPIPAAQDYVLTDSSKPEWLVLDRLPAKPGDTRPTSFGRTLSLSNANGNAVMPEDYRKLYDKFPEVYKIVVYEYQDGDLFNVIAYKRSAEQKERTYGNGGPLTTWGVQLAARAKPAGDAPKDK